MGAATFGTAFLLLATVQGPPTGETCRIEYAEVVGSATSIRTALVEPGSNRTFNASVLRVTNRDERAVEIRILPPAGNQATVTLQHFGATDPPVMEYVGNWTLKSAHCPHLFPSPTHMWDQGATLEEVQQEFDLDPLEAAILIRPRFADISGVGWGAVAELVQAFPDAIWDASATASLLRQAEYPAAAVIHGLVVNEVVPSIEGGGAFPLAMSAAVEAGYDPVDVLRGTRGVLDVVSGPQYEEYWRGAPKLTLWMMEAGYSYTAAAESLKEVLDIPPRDFMDAFYYYTREARGDEAVGRTVRVLRDVFGVEPVAATKFLMMRRKANFYAGASMAPPAPVPEPGGRWAATRAELTEGLYSNRLERCGWIGRAWQELLQIPIVNGSPGNAILDQTSALVDDSLDIVAFEFSDDPGRARCLLEGFSAPRVVAYAVTRGTHPSAPGSDFAPGFRDFGYECPALMDLLSMNGIGAQRALKWAQRAEYPDLRSCIARLGEIHSTFFFELYRQALGPEAAARQARSEGWEFERTADAMDWFRAPEPRFGPTVTSYQVSPTVALGYLRGFARAQGREDVFDYLGYLMEGFSLREVCSLVQGPRGARVPGLEKPCSSR